MGLFGKPDVGKLKEQGNVRGLIKALKNKDDDIKHDAAGALGQMKENKAVRSLIQIFAKEGSYRLRGRAAYSLGMIGHSDAIEPLSRALNGSEWLTGKQMIIDALGMIGHKEAIQPLAQFLHGTVTSSEYNVAGIAISKYGEAAVDPLVEVLKNENSAGRQAAVTALRRIGGDKAEKGVLIAVEDSDMAVRAQAAMALGDFGSSTAIEALNRIWDDESETGLVKTRATDALRKIKSKKGSK